MQSNVVQQLHIISHLIRYMISYLTDYIIPYNSYDTTTRETNNYSKR